MALAGEAVRRACLVAAVLACVARPAAAHIGSPNVLFDGNAGPKADFKCVEFETGKVKWAEAKLGAGALMIADGKLIIHSDKGELIIAEATPDSFKPISRAQVTGGRNWTTPVLSNGRIYCRNAKGDLVCLDVKEK